MGGQEQKLQVKAVVIQITIILLIAFPFFRIRYFETTTANQLIVKYLVYPISIISLALAAYLYFGTLRRFDKPTNWAVKRKLRDVFFTALLTIIFSAAIYGLALSAIVTSNAYLSPQRTVTINEPVIEYKGHVIRRGWQRGRVRHRIRFVNPVDGMPITFEVYRKYSVGEKFNKEMKVGHWGQLYSIN